MRLLGAFLAVVVMRCSDAFSGAALSERQSAPDVVSESPMWSLARVNKSCLGRAGPCPRSEQVERRR
jgi:hypothetical protein